MVEFLKGKKTYIVAVGILGVAIAQSMGVVIPDAVWAALAAIGLGSIRAAVAAVENGKSA